MIVKSPCVGICQMKNDVCLGCGRSREQISYWRNYTEQEKLNIISEIKQYNKQSKEKKNGN